jgi:hypothetical protein
MNEGATEIRMLTWLVMEIHSGWGSPSTPTTFMLEQGQNFVLSGVPLVWLQQQAVGTVVLDPTEAIQPDASAGEENWIYKSGGGNDNYGASSGWQVAPDRSTYERRALIKFNRDHIPSNASVVSADLDLWVYTTWGTASSFTAEVH